MLMLVMLVLVMLTLRDVGAADVDLQGGEKPEPVSQLCNRAYNLSASSLQINYSLVTIIHRQLIGDNYLMITIHLMTIFRSLVTIIHQQLIGVQLFDDNISSTII